MMINRIMCISMTLTDLCFKKRRITTKNTFVTVVYSVLVVKMCWQSIKIKSINDAQPARLEKGTIEFKNYVKQIPVPFKIYADFECNIKSVESYEGSYSKKYQDHVPCSFAYKLVCVDERFTKLIVVFRGENAAYKFIEAILKDFKYYKKVMKKIL